MVDKSKIKSALNSTFDGLPAPKTNPTEKMFFRKGKVWDVYESRGSVGKNMLMVTAEG